MPTDDERREVARRLRELASDDEEVSDFDLAKTLDLGAVSRYGYDPRDVERLADLIDPTCEVHRDTLFYPATELTPETESTVFRCGACEEIVSFDEDYDPKTDAPVYCEMCGSRITGIGEPWNE